jgi:hypothetical protein
MRKHIYLAIIFIMETIPMFAQDTIDSLAQNLIYQPDSAKKILTQEVDSVHKQFVHRTDSLQKAYAGPLYKIQSSIEKLNHKKDSLSHLPLQTKSVNDSINSLQKKINQVQRKQMSMLKELNSKIDKVKSETLTKISVLHLPRHEVDALTKNIQGFNVPGVPDLSKSLSRSLPSDLINIPATNIPSLQKFNLGSLRKVPSPQVEGSIGNELSQLQSLDNMKSIEQTAVKELSQNAEVKSLLKAEDKVKEMEGEFSKVKDIKEAEAMAKKQLEPAINHFVGKEKELQSAMSQLSLCKQKYSDVKSLVELPKRPPNPFKDKPWTERVVSGLNYFILRGNSVFVDLNPYVGWLFHPKLTASIGWNERVGISHGQVSTSPQERVYGVRTNFSYQWLKGFLFSLSPEVMSSYVLTGGTPDSNDRTVVFGLFGGIRKDFRIYKSVSGYTEGMYNFTHNSSQNIYGGPLTLRFGIEATLKKKAKNPR